VRSPAAFVTPSAAFIPFPFSIGWRATIVHPTSRETKNDNAAADWLKITREAVHDNLVGMCMHGRRRHDRSCATGAGRRYNRRAAAGAAGGGRHGVAYSRTGEHRGNESNRGRHQSGNSAARAHRHHGCDQRSAAERDRNQRRFRQYIESVDRHGGLLDGGPSRPGSAAYPRSGQRPASWRGRSEHIESERSARTSTRYRHP
jgi:hypothetical protein